VERQLKILKAAEILFGKKGFDAVSVSEIARKARTSKSLIFHHFKSKQNLIERIIASRLDEIEKALLVVLSEETCPPDTKVKKFVSTYFELIAKHIDFYRILVRETLNQRKEILNYIFEHNRRLIEALSKVLKEGIERNVFRSDIDPNKVAFSIVANINAFVTAESLSKIISFTVLEERDLLASQLIRIFFEGMLKR
jgi:AcrR family transcriptional regulator